jgi:hypothetical protein
MLIFNDFFKAFDAAAFKLVAGDKTLCSAIPAGDRRAV